MSRTILTNARIVTPEWDDTGTVVIEGKYITEIIRGRSFADGEDLRGLWLAPGCIDIHSDYLEREIRPRPSAEFSLPLAFHYMDQRAIACGLTTVFSAISFSANEEHARDFDSAIDRAKHIDEIRGESLARHFVHARLDPNIDAVVDHLQSMQEIRSLTMVVYNDSIPGQRQFRLEDLVEKRSEMLGISRQAARAMLDEKIAERSRVNHRDKIMQAFKGRAILGSHDDTTVEHVDEARLFAATLAEMPTTMAAARRARELGMLVCMGAPNYVRGGSHCGNLSCADAMAEGYVDMICSDYHFPSMFGCVVRMLANGISPSRAFEYVSLNPARLINASHMLGSIEVGKEADLVSFKPAADFAKVHQVFVAGARVYQAQVPGLNPNMTAAVSREQNVA